MSTPKRGTRITPKGTVPRPHTRHTSKVRNTAQTLKADSSHNAIAAAVLAQHAKGKA